MKKIISLAIMLSIPVLSGCGSDKPTPEDYVSIQNETKKDNLTVVGIGVGGDYIIKLEKNDVLTKIANKEKTVKFLSVENPKQYIEEGYCLLNIIPNTTMQAMSMPENKCNFRLFCGSAEEMNYDEMYAVEICEE